MKKGIIICCVLFLILLVSASGFYIWGLGSKEKNMKLVNFIIEPGQSKTTIASNLENAGLIRSKYALDLYLFFTTPNIQAGEYELSPSMKPEEMIKKFKNGDIKIKNVTVTLIEGKRLKDYAETLGNNFSFTKEEFINAANDKTYLQELISNGSYWFLTNTILNENIYYPLEGYLYPDTYEFLETATPTEIIETLLNHTLKKLEPYKEEIVASGKSVHDILTMASIVEKEANTKSDREKASQVFYSRLLSNMSLGSDVTAYYGVQKEMNDFLTSNDLYDQNLYNTRLTDGTMNGKLPIGPICNSDITSIEAALRPSNTNYYYFVANVCTGEVFFQENYQEFIEKNRELQSICSAN